MPIFSALSPKNGKYANLYNHTKTQYEGVLNKNFTLDQAIANSDLTVSQTPPEQIKRVYVKRKSKSSSPITDSKVNTNKPLADSGLNVTRIFDKIIESFKKQGFDNILANLRKADPDATAYELLIQQMARNPEIVLNIIPEKDIAKIYGNTDKFESLNHDQRVEFLSLIIKGQSALKAHETVRE